MTLNTIQEAIQDLQQGKMIILVDDEDRENEGDLVIAAEKITPEAVNFMTKYARGLVCLAMTKEIVDRLKLPMMTVENRSRFGTNFTVSIEARTGVTTGISAFDRATTILTAIADGATAHDLVSPGHIFPLRAAEGGVLTREGQTEGSVDLARLAGLKPAAVICEIMDDDGSMARLPSLKKFAALHNLKIVSIEDLIAYIKPAGAHKACEANNNKKNRGADKNSILINRQSSAILPTIYGNFVSVVYENKLDGSIQIALVKGTIIPTVPVVVRIHSECLTGDVFGSLRCDCGGQLEAAMEKIAQEDCGILLYLRQEGRGIGLANKISAYALQDQGYDTVEANHALGFVTDLREYNVAAQILVDLGAKKIKLLTNNPEKIVALNRNGLKVVERIALEVPSSDNNLFYLQTKKAKMGHLLELKNKEGR